jgi:adenylyltransferase/sulfurtransferase
MHQPNQNNSTPTQDASRYLKQIRFAPIGAEGQIRIQQSKVLICGCGALGSMIAERLARAGVGNIRIVDRDWVELSNLQRQTLFTEQHALAATPKAVAAASVLDSINSSLHIEPIVDDLTCDNIQALAQGCDLILDGTDNFETRFLINDYCIQNGIPWIHAGCLGASGQVLSVLPGKSACFRCLVPEMPSPEVLQSCDSAGVLGPSVGLIACWQAAEALKLLSGHPETVCTQLIVIDTWDTDCRKVNLRPVPDCPSCGLRDFPFLEGRIRTQTVVLCGKNAVQIIRPDSGGSLNELVAIFERLRPLGEVQLTNYYVRLKLPDHQLTFFRGGRTVVEGTSNPAEAKTIIARTLGS